MVLCAEQTREKTSNADPKNHTLFSALSGLKMGSTSVRPGHILRFNVVIHCLFILSLLLNFNPNDDKAEAAILFWFE